MKILHIITRLILGGAQKNTVLSCRTQQANGHDVHLAYGPIYGPEGSLENEAEDACVTLHVVDSMRRAVLPHKDIACYYALRKLIRQLKPDVVHTHSSKAGIIGRAAAWKERVPAVVHTIHGLPFHEKQPRWLYKTYVTAERFASQRCHCLIGITNAMVTAFKQNRIGRDEQFDVVPSGIELSEFEVETAPRDVTRKAYGIAADAPVIGIVARLDPLKGHDDLLTALPKLLEKHPDLRLLFVGDGWNRENLEQRIEDEGLDKHVVLAGLVPPNQVPSLLGAMDIMALPSYQEGQGRTLVEALLCGCAVVGYDVGGIGEVCIDQQTGRLAPVGDVDALADCLMWMLDHPGERQLLMEAGRAHVKQHFTADYMCRRLEEIYSRLLA